MRVKWGVPDQERRVRWREPENGEEEFVCEIARPSFWMGWFWREAGMVQVRVVEAPGERDWEGLSVGRRVSVAE